MTLQPRLEGLADYHPAYRAKVVQLLADFRREWQKATGAQSLMDTQVSLGLLLSDIADQLGLNLQERHAMLGGKLINEVNAFMEQRVSLELTS